MKRLYLTLPLIMIFLLTPLSIYADLPDNDYDSSYELAIIDVTANGSASEIHDPLLFQYGDLYYLYFQSAPVPTSGSAYFYFNVDFSLSSSADFYFLESFSSVEVSSPSFSLVPTQFLNKSTNATISPSSRIQYDSFLYSGEYNQYNFFYDVNGSIYLHTTLTGNSPFRLSFSCFKNVPSGSYRLKFSVPFDSSDSSFYIPLGFFLDRQLSGNPVQDYKYDDISFEAANNAINSELQTIVSAPNLTNVEKQALISITNSKLEQLQSLSDAKFSDTVDGFDESSGAIVDDYIISGSIDVLPAIGELDKLYSESLQAVNTPEQGILINSRYNARLSQIKAVYDVNYNQALENVISDQQFQEKQEAYDNLDDLLELEASTHEIFLESDYNSYIQFQDWYSSLNPSDFVLIKSIYEFLFNDDASLVIRPFLTIPFSLVLVGIILATTSAVSRRKSDG